MATESTEHPDRIVIYPSRWKAVLILLGASAFVALGFWIASPGIASRVGAVEKFIASYVGIPFFAACGLYAAYRIAFRRPALQIDATGITDTSHAFSPGHLCWHEVDRVVLYEYQSQPMLGIIPKDLDSFLSRQSAHVRTYAKTNLGLSVPPFNIAQVTLPTSVAELAKLIQTRYGVRVEDMRTSPTSRGDTRQPN
ncbi:MAG TPA: STM3941 family protein [Candidatus Eisenbacteria bacterium]|nr:STM3941 family protein [Candidatus Eisenbacteria bacterium]